MKNRRTRKEGYRLIRLDCLETKVKPPETGLGSPAPSNDDDAPERSEASCV